ncbi:hypothetical protein AGMMS49975_26060 [Clostridia bacterium]|nr:hypothetical protein AGMMS49975_26060 [Clostridia bacterium]
MISLKGTAEQNENTAAEPTEPTTPTEPTEPTEPEKLDSVKVTISSGMSAEKIAQLLANSEIVDDSAKFLQFLKDKNSTKKISTGTYEFSKNQSYESVLNRLTKK